MDPTEIGGNPGNGKCKILANYNEMKITRFRCHNSSDSYSKCGEKLKEQEDYSTILETKEGVFGRQILQKLQTLLALVIILKFTLFTPSSVLDR